MHILNKATVIVIYDTIQYFSPELCYSGIIVRIPKEENQMLPISTTEMMNDSSVIREESRLTGRS